MVSGPIASGKGEVTNVIRNVYGSSNVSVFVLSDLLRAEAKRRNLDVTRENLKIIGDEWRKQMGAGVLGKKIIPLVSKLSQQNRIVVIDSVRLCAEADVMRNVFTSILFLFVEADEQIRAQRVLLRARSDDKTIIDIPQVLRQEWRDFELLGLRQMADVIIDGSLPLAKMQQKIEDALFAK